MLEKIIKIQTWYRAHRHKHFFKNMLLKDIYKSKIAMREKLELMNQNVNQLMDEANQREQDL